MPASPPKRNSPDQRSGDAIRSGYLSQRRPAAPYLHAAFLSAPAAGLVLDRLDHPDHKAGPVPGLLIAPDQLPALYQPWIGTPTPCAGQPLATAVASDASTGKAAIAALTPVFRMWQVADFDGPTPSRSMQSRSRGAPDSLFQDAAHIYRLTIPLTAGAKDSAHTGIADEPEQLMAVPRTDGRIALYSSRAIAPLLTGDDRQQAHRRALAEIRQQANRMGGQAGQGHTPLSAEDVIWMDDHQRVRGAPAASAASFARLAALICAARQTGQPVLWQAQAADRPAASIRHHGHGGNGLVIDAVLSAAGSPQALRLHMSGTQSTDRQAEQLELNQASTRLLAAVPKDIRAAAVTLCAHRPAQAPALGAGNTDNPPTGSAGNTIDNGLATDLVEQAATIVETAINSIGTLTGNLETDPGTDPTRTDLAKTDQAGTAPRIPAEARWQIIANDPAPGADSVFASTHVARCDLFREIDIAPDTAARALASPAALAELLPEFRPLPDRPDRKDRGKEEATGDGQIIAGTAMLNIGTLRDLVRLSVRPHADNGPDNYGPKAGDRPTPAYDLLLVAPALCMAITVTMDIRQVEGDRTRIGLSLNGRFGGAAAAPLGRDWPAILRAIGRVMLTHLQVPDDPDGGARWGRLFRRRKD